MLSPQEIISVATDPDSDIKWGCDAQFVRLNKTWGLKWYRNQQSRDNTYAMQQIAHAHGFGPAVGQTEVSVGRVNSFVFTPDQLSLLAKRQGKPLSFRVDGEVFNEWRGIFGWDGGAGGHPPTLRLEYTPPIVELP